LKLVKMYFSSFSILNFSIGPTKICFPILVYNRFPVFYVKYGCYVHLVIGVDHLSYFYVPILPKVRMYGSQINNNSINTPPYGGLSHEPSLPMVRMYGSSFPDWTMGNKMCRCHYCAKDVHSICIHRVIQL